MVRWYPFNQPIGYLLGNYKVPIIKFSSTRYNQIYHIWKEPRIHFPRHQINCKTLECELWCIAFTCSDMSRQTSRAPTRCSTAPAAVKARGLITFGSRDVEKVHAVVARTTFWSQNVKSTTVSDHFWRFRCRFASLPVTRLHYKKHYTPLHYITLRYIPLH